MPSSRGEDIRNFDWFIIDLVNILKAYLAQAIILGAHYITFLDISTFHYGKQVNMIAALVIYMQVYNKGKQSRWGG